MWSNDKNFLGRGLSATPPPTWKSKPLSYSPIRMTPLSEKKQRSSPSSKTDLFHVIHKVPTGDSPYVRAKHVQLIDRDPSKAISLFWQAINSGDRVDSALKDMAVVMKQLNRSDEAIEAIKSFRHLCPNESQESLDNVLVELYKRSGRIEEEIEMLQHKLKHIEEGTAFGGKRTKIARSQGKKIQITIEQERSRILGNLAWAHLQLYNFKTAEELYRKALYLDPDKNKQCNLALCLMHMNRITEAKSLLQAVRASSKDGQMDESYAKSFDRAFQMLTELESPSVLNPVRKEENFKEIRRSFTSPSNRNSKELTSVNGGQENISGFVNSRRCGDGNDEETILLNGQNRGIYGQDQFAGKDTFPRYNTGYSEGILFQPRSGLQSSPQTLFVDKWKKGAYHENLLKPRSDFTSSRTENLVSASEMEVGSGFAYRKMYASPVYARRNPKVPSTEPRRGSCLYNRELWGDDAVGDVSRKISFEQPLPVENAQVQASPQNHNGGLLASINESSKVAQQKWRTGSPFPIGGDWRRRSWGDLTLNGRNGNLESANSIRSTGANEEQCFEGNNSGLHKPITGNLKPTQDLSIYNSKKSWADMVEEEEEELLSGRTNFPEKKWDHLFQEPSYSIQNSMKCLDGWDSGEEFNDENMNSNIICQTPCPPNHIDNNLRQKLESFDLKDDYSKSGNGFSSRNTTVRRSLCFDHHHQQQQQPPPPPDPVEYFCSSPLPKNALNLEGSNCVEADERESSSSSSLQKNIMRPMRRNRLQVFRDITLLPESP